MAKVTIPRAGDLAAKVPRPGPALVVTGLLGLFVGAATVALVRRLLLGRPRRGGESD